MKEYVLVSQGIELFRTEDKMLAKAIMIKENKKWRKYKQECIENNEPYSDNEIEMFEEEKKDE